MRKQTIALSCLLSFGCAAHLATAPELPDRVDLSYTIERVLTPIPAVKVSLTAAGAASGETTFTLGDAFAGLEHSEDEVHAFSVVGHDGRSLVVAHAPGHAWVVTHAPHEQLRAEYYLVSRQQDLGDDSADYYRPQARAHVVHLIGTTALVYPAQLDEAKHRIAFSWRGFDRWQTATSFGLGRDVVVDEPIDRFRQAVFFASDEARVLPRAIGDTTLAIAIAGQWQFADASFADLATKVVETERAFFHERGPAFFLISLLPVGDGARKGYTIGGTGLTSSFATFMTPNVVMTGERGERVKWLLAHELFHNWNGLTISPRAPERLSYWFTEGFTNFYARRLLYRAGLLSLASYLSHLNEELEHYLSSSVRNEPNAKIQAEFWQTPAVGKLPYYRGDIVALVVDAEIRRVSNGARSLDDLMKAMVERARKGEKIDPALVLAAIAEQTSSDFAPDLLAPCLPLDEKSRFMIGDASACASLL